jgi:hypothetical protein
VIDCTVRFLLQCQNSLRVKFRWDTCRRDLLALENAVLKAIDNAKTRGKKPEDVEKIVSDALNERELDFQSSKYDATRKVGGEKASGRGVMLSRPRVCRT